MRLSAPKTERQYYGNPRLAFQDGFYVQKNQKRIADTFYYKYHYFLPNAVMPAIKFLKTYFEKLDKPLPDYVYRRRTSSMEYAETAVNVLTEIYNRISVCHTILAGSEQLSALPWAVFGKNCRLTKHNFATINSIFKHYDQFICSKGYNIATVLYRKDRLCSSKKLKVLSERYDKSPNYVLAVAILLLYDLVHNCGPDANEFMMLFNNDKRQTMKDTIARWHEMRKELIPDSQPREVAETYRSAFAPFSPSNYYSKTSTKLTSTYSDVVIVDCDFSPYLADGEKTILFEKKEKTGITVDHAAKQELPETTEWIGDWMKHLQWIGERGYDF